MKRTILISIICLAFTVNNAFTAEFIAPKGDNSVIDQNYDDDVFLAGNTIRLDSKIRGDLFTACNEVVQADSVDGNLIAACKSIQSLGAVGRSFIGFGYSISCNAPIGRNLLAFGNQVDIGPDVFVGMDASLFGEKAVFQGTVKRNLKVDAKQLIFSGRVDGDLEFEGDYLTITSDAVVKGNLIYCSPEKAEIDNLANISGDIKWTQCEIEDKSGPSATGVFEMLVSHRGYFLFLAVYSLLMFIISVIPFPSGLSFIVLLMAFLISGNLFLLITKKIGARTEKALVQRPFPSLGVGFGIIFLTPLITLMLLVSVFAAPLGAILILIFGVASFAAYIYTALYIGRRICQFLKISSSVTSKGYGCFTLGIVILMTLFYIPVLGYIISLLTVMLGLGGLALGIYGKQDEPTA